MMYTLYEPDRANTAATTIPMGTTSKSANVDLNEMMRFLCMTPSPWPRFS